MWYDCVISVLHVQESSETSAMKWAWYKIRNLVNVQTVPTTKNQHFRPYLYCSIPKSTLLFWACNPKNGLLPFLEFCFGEITKSWAASLKKYPFQRPVSKLLSEEGKEGKGKRANSQATNLWPSPPLLLPTPLDKRFLSCLSKRAEGLWRQEQERERRERGKKLGHGKENKERS